MMSSKLRIQLKANERVLVNGGMIKVDRKVAIEFLNDVAFLLEAHIIEPHVATTPLERLYVIVQSMLVDPPSQAIALQEYLRAHRALMSSIRNQDLLEGLCDAKRFVEGGRPFDALKKIRSLFELEQLVQAAERTSEAS